MCTETDYWLLTFTDTFAYQSSSLPVQDPPSLKGGARALCSQPADSPSSSGSMSPLSKSVHKSVRKAVQQTVHKALEGHGVSR